eukprot:gene10190-9608_t
MGAYDVTSNVTDEPSITVPTAGASASTSVERRIASSDQAVVTGTRDQFRSWWPFDWERQWAAAVPAPPGAAASEATDSFAACPLLLGHQADAPSPPVDAHPHSTPPP